MSAREKAAAIFVLDTSELSYGAPPAVGLCRLFRCSSHSYTFYPDNGHYEGIWYEFHGTTGTTEQSRALIGVFAAPVMKDQSQE
jgi:hypothetical protein